MYRFDSFRIALASLQAEWHSAAHSSTRVQGSCMRGVAAVEIIVAVLTAAVLATVIAAVVAVAAVSCISSCRQDYRLADAVTNVASLLTLLVACNIHTLHPGTHCS
jgi:hypothetical protein